MSTLKRFILAQIQCPACKWRDAGIDHQLRLVWSKTTDFDIRFELVCHECGAAHLMVLTLENFGISAAKLDYTVPVHSIIPF